MDQGTKRCEVRLGNGRICGEIAISVVESVCLHDHYETSLIGVDCLAKLGWANCGPCKDDPVNPHLCDVLVREVSHQPA